MDKFEEQIHNDLHQYLLSVNEIDERLPECPDVENPYAPRQLQRHLKHHCLKWIWAA